MINPFRRFSEGTLAAVVYTGETRRGTVTALWSDQPAVAVTWRIADQEGRVVADHTGDYLDAEQLLLNVTASER